MRVKPLVRRAVISLLVAAALGTSATACTSKENVVAPEEARDVLVSIIQDTAAKLGASGWNEDGAPGIQSCDRSGVGGVKFGYGYGAPQPGGDHLADAETVAEYWESLGMTVRIDSTNEPVVFGEGGQIQGLRFSTAPGDYYIAGTSLCVPGNADELRESEYKR